MIETTEEDDVKLSAEDEERSEQWSLVSGLRAGSLALRRAAVRAHFKAGNRSGAKLEEAFRRAASKNDQAETLLSEAERLVRELNGEDEDTQS